MGESRGRVEIKQSKEGTKESAHNNANGGAPVGEVILKIEIARGVDALEDNGCRAKRWI